MVEEGSWTELAAWAKSLPGMPPRRDELVDVVDHLGALVGRRRWSRLCETPLLVLAAITAVDPDPPDDQAIAFAEFADDSQRWVGRLSRQVWSAIPAHVDAMGTAVNRLRTGIEVLESFPWPMAADYLTSLGALATTIASAAPSSLRSIEARRATRIVELASPG